MTRGAPGPAIGPQTGRLFGAILALTVVARGGAYLPGYSIDDYGIALRDTFPVELVGQGRFGQAVLLRVLEGLDLESFPARVFFVTVACLAWSLLGTLVVRHWGLTGRGWLPLAVGGIVATHPYGAELFTFRAALGPSIVPLAIFSTLLVPRRWSPRLVLLGAAVFAVTLSIYQVVLHFALMIVLLGAVIRLTRFLVIEEARGWRRRPGSIVSLEALTRHRQGALLSCTVLGTLAYLVAGAVASTALGVTLVQRSRFLAPAALVRRAWDVGAVLRHRLWAPDPLVAPLTKTLLLLLLVGTLGALLLRTRPWRRPRTRLAFLALTALVGASLVWMVGIILVLDEFWPVARIMSHAGILWGGVLAAGHYGSGRWGRRGLALLATAIVLSFIGSNNHILNDQYRLNQRDALRASRIVARLEALPDFSSIDTVVMDGGEWRYPLPYEMVDRDMNISAFGAAWAKVAIVREMAGYNLKETKDAAARQAAAGYCRGVKPWPAPESVVSRGRLAIVCLSK